MTSHAPTGAGTELLGPDETARHLGVRRRFVMDCLRRGELLGIVYRRGRDGRATVVAFDRADLDRFIAKKRTNGAGQTKKRAQEDRS